MRKLNLFFIFSLILFPALAQAKTCIDDNRTKCYELGFTKGIGVCGNGVACPYDPTRWYCPEYTCEDGRYLSDYDTTYYTSCSTVWYKTRNCWKCECADTKPNCAIGDIFFSDGTCSDQYGECLGKIPVGVVYMLTDAQGNIVNSERSLHGRVINLKDLTISTSTYTFNPAAPYGGDTTIFPWGIAGADTQTSYGGINAYVLSSMLKGSQGNESSSGLFTGKQNTAKIIKATPQSCLSSYQPNTENYADRCYPTSAQATLKFYPDSSLKNNALVGAGKWYLPSIGELAYLFGADRDHLVPNSSSVISYSSSDAKILMNQKLEALSRKGVTASSLGNAYYSSNESEGYAAWVINNSSEEITTEPPNKLYGFNAGYVNAGVRASLEFHNIACTSEYSLTTCPENATCSTCKNGKKKIDSCSEGYEPSLDGSQCEPAPCKIGYIYYADGTCSDTDHYNSGKTPVGVVYMIVDDSGNIVNDSEASKHGRVINLKDLAVSSSDKTFNPDDPYSGSALISVGLYGTLTPGLAEFNSDTLLSALKNSVGSEGSAEIYNGKDNTAKMAQVTTTVSKCTEGNMREVDWQDQCVSTAADATLQFAPSTALKSDSNVGAGQWYLPAIGELIQLYGIDISAIESGNGASGADNSNINKINETLSFLSGQGIEAAPFRLAPVYYWSSTQSSAQYNWIITMYSGARINNIQNLISHHIRASLQF